MEIPNRGGPDQDEDARADDAADAQARQIPGGQGLLQAMFGTIAVGEDLFNGLGAEETAQSHSSLVNRDSKIPLFHWISKTNDK
jgi:hypothetical protein